MSAVVLDKGRLVYERYNKERKFDEKIFRSPRDVNDKNRCGSGCGTLAL